jgi:ribose transport system ATP-binding protein
LAESGREEVVLRVAGVSKSFPGTQALHEVELDVRRGEIHALAGANGSGKSTLVKILAGVLAADEGTIEAAAEIHVVHQDPSVFLDLSVADNLALGRGYETSLLRGIRWRAVRRRTKDVLERFEIAARPETIVRALPPSARAMIAIARALQDQEGRRRGVLVLDEPTAALPRPEVERLLEVLRRYAEAGQSMLFVSHDLDEVLGLAKRVTVLRDGRVVVTAPASELSHAKLVALITGQTITTAATDPQVTDGDKATVLEARGVTDSVLHDVDFEVAAGEILALAGLVGSGAAEILRCIFGARVPDEGTVFVAGERLSGGIGDAIARGIVYVPGDRTVAVFPELSIRENLSVAQVGRYWRGFMDRRREHRDARQAMETFRVRAAHDGQPLRTASGGNQQKIVLARWLQRDPRVILLEEPTQGVDVAARAEIYELIRHAADAGAAVVIVSLDFEELERICDRALVVNDGRIVAELRRPHIDHETLTRLAYAKRVA